MRRREYCYKAVLNPGYILYISRNNTGFSVRVTDEKRAHDYTVYGSYKNIGTAENRLLTSANSYKSNQVSFYYAGKDYILAHNPV